jgi:catechol 2,3-dioxygenase-like lactoylglutathione lyase family enzyme
MPVTGKIGNITFDCANPRELSYFWSDVLGYPRADWPPEMKADLLAGGLTEADLELKSVAQDPTGVGQRLYFQKVPEGKVVKNRVHLDINSTPGRRATPEEIEAEKDRIVALGATVVLKYDEPWGPVRELHYVMQDPEGNEFCIQ